MSIGGQIRKYREIKEFTKEEFAMKVRMGVQTLEYYESNERQPELDTILKISTVLDIPASELIDFPADGRQNIDQELEDLIQEVGVRSSKLILKKMRDFSEQDVLQAINLFFEPNSPKK